MNFRLLMIDLKYSLLIEATEDPTTVLIRNEAGNPGGRHSPPGGFDLR